LRQNARKKRKRKDKEGRIHPRERKGGGPKVINRERERDGNKKHNGLCLDSCSEVMSLQKCWLGFWLMFFLV
jgi:hypothetical protein